MRGVGEHLIHRLLNLIRDLGHFSKSNENNKSLQVFNQRSVTFSSVVFKITLVAT